MLFSHIKNKALHIQTTLLDNMQIPCKNEVPWLVSFLGGMYLNRKN